MEIVATINKHEFQTCWIIGKGASLAHLKKEHIGQGVVIALNNSIIKVESLGLDNQIYSLQQDGCYEFAPFPPKTIPPPGHTCVPEVPQPKRATLIVSKYLSANCLPHYSPRIVLDIVETFHTVMAIPTSHVALYLAKWFGCVRVICVSFDSHENGDTRTYEAHLGRVVQQPDPYPEMVRGISRDFDYVARALGIETAFFLPRPVP